MVSDVQRSWIAKTLGVALPDATGLRAEPSPGRPTGPTPPGAPPQRTARSPEAAPPANRAPDADAFRARWPDAKAAWLDALDQVNAQISQLQAAFRNTQSPLGIEIADKGLIGLTGHLQVSLRAAIIEVDGAPPDRLPPAIAGLHGAAAAMQDFLASDRVLPLLENNPFNVPVTTRSLLRAALTVIMDACAK